MVVYALLYCRPGLKAIFSVIYNMYQGVSVQSLYLLKGLKEIEITITPYPDL